MSKLNILLVIALLGSALLLVKTAYESRQLFAALDQARVEQKQLDAEFKRLDAERQDQATHRRVERVARDKLAMSNATQGATVFVEDSVAGASR